MPACLRAFRCRWLLPVVAAGGLLWLAACSGPAEPPRGAFGLTFGDAPPGDMVAVTVPLPGDLADALAYYTRPGSTGTFLGVALADPVLAFYRGHFFSLAASLADPADSPLLRRRLGAACGAPYCREAAGTSVCLWRAADVEATLEGPPDGPARFMLRHRPVAEAVLAGRGGMALDPEGAP